MFRLTRRDFLRAASSAAIVTLFSRLPEEFLAFEFIEPIEPSINPLEQYPNRGWENI